MPDEIEEDFVDVDLEFGRGFEEGAVELLGEAVPLILADDAFVLQVALVADQHHRDVVRVLDAENLLAQVHEVVERALSRDRVDENETLPVLHVQIPHGRELLRARRVEDFQHTLVRVHFHLRGWRRDTEEGGG